jgi:hypothetical protein
VLGRIACFGAVARVDRVWSAPPRKLRVMILKSLHRGADRRLSAPPFGMPCFFGKFGLLEGTRRRAIGEWDRMKKERVGNGDCRSSDWERCVVMGRP